MRNFLIIILLASCSLGFSQSKKPSIRFLSDSVMMGELVEVELLYKHSKELEVLFPDSSFNYEPFEFVEKKLFTTRSEDSVSLDCTIYILQTFELDSRQGLHLGVTLFSTKDSFKVYSNSDSVYLKEMILQMPDTVRLVANTEFLEVEKEFNYPYFLIGLGILGLGGLISVFVF